MVQKKKFSVMEKNIDLFHYAELKLYGIYCTIYYRGYLKKREQ